MRTWLAFLAAAVLLLLMFVLAGGAARRESVTVDEVAHIGAGLSYVQKLDLRFNYEHPPLVKVLAGLPLAIRGTRADYSSPQWTIGARFLPAYMAEWVFGDWLLGRWNNAETTLLWARLPMLLLTLLLGWVLFVIGRRFGGDWGGLTSLAAYASMPAFLAFGPLVLTDVAIALFAVLTLWTLADLWRDPSPGNTRWFALALAGALLSKFSSGILLLAVLAFVLSTRRWPLADQPDDKAAARAWRRLRWRALRKGTWLAAAAGVRGVFRLLLEPAGGHSRVCRPRAVAGSGRPPADAAVAVPARPGLDAVHLRAFVVPSGPCVSARGLVLLPGVAGSEIVAGFPRPVGVDAGALPVAQAEVPRRRRPFRPGWPPTGEPSGCRCWCSPASVWPAPWTSASAISAFRWRCSPCCWRRSRALSNGAGGARRSAAAALAAVLVASCLIDAVRLYPYYLQYASPAGMGRPLYWLMSDSNVDWNQALPEVEQFARQHGLADVPLDNYGFSDARVIVPQSRIWDCQAPADIRRGPLGVRLRQHDSRRPQLRLDHAVSPSGAGGWRHVCDPASLPIPPAGTAGGPPLPAERRIFLGMPMDMRVMDRELTGASGADSENHGRHDSGISEDQALSGADPLVRGRPPGRPASRPAGCRYRRSRCGTRASRADQGSAPPATPPGGYWRPPAPACSRCARSRGRYDTRGR